MKKKHNVHEKQMSLFDFAVVRDEALTHDRLQSGRRGVRTLAINRV